MNDPDHAQPETFELVALAGGVHSLRSRANGQTFHPVVGPAAEAAAVHVGGTRLVERADAHFAPAAGGNGPFVIWDVGLGAAANALAAIDALMAGDTRGADVELLSFDRSAGALDFALANAAALTYPLPHTRTLAVLRDDQETVVPLRDGTLRWRLRLEDFPALVAGGMPLPAPHAVFFDPYSPAANPEMWTLELFTALRGRLRDDAPCLLTNYTRSTAVRVTLLLAGFHVGVGPATGEKDQTTVAANIPALLTHPLPRAWLEKTVSASTNAAPLRAGAGYARGPISDGDLARLRAHGQFA